VKFNNWGGGETNATFAQMLRLVEDTRCFIKGSGTIHNYPSQGSSTPCAGPSGYLQILQSEGIGTGNAIDPTALIVAPSNDPQSDLDMAFSPNLLYCSANPAKDYKGATTCTWAPAVGGRRSHQLHRYVVLGIGCSRCHQLSLLQLQLRTRGGRLDDQHHRRIHQRGRPRH
jgi:hypothetical protein